MATPIFDHVQPKIFNQLLIFVNLYNHAKNEAASSICVCAGTQQIMHIFIIEQIHRKLMTKFCFDSKNPSFGPFPQFFCQCQGEISQICLPRLAENAFLEAFPYTSCMPSLQDYLIKLLVFVLTLSPL